MFQWVRLTILLYLTSQLYHCAIVDPLGLKFNEVKLDPSTPFVEMRKPPTMLYGQSDLDGYGLLITQLKLSYVQRDDAMNFVDLKSFIDFKGLKLRNDQEYTVVDMSDYLGTRSYILHLDIPEDQWMIKGRGADLFKVMDNNIIALFLVYSSKNLMDYEFLSHKTIDHKMMLSEFIRTHSIDSIVITSPNGPLHSLLVEKVLKVPAAQYIPDVGNKDWLSISKCNNLDEPFNLLNYKYGQKTPGTKIFLIFDTELFH